MNKFLLNIIGQDYVCSSLHLYLFQANLYNQYYV